MTTPTNYAPQFKFTPREYVLHNSAPDAFDIRWGGLMFTVPGVDEVGNKPARYEDGEPIPGTCVLKDSSSPGPEGVVVRGNWRAEDAIRNVLGIDVETGLATGMAARHGISFLPNGPSKEFVKSVREDGEKRWHESQIEWAEQTVAAQQVAIEKASAAGAMPPTPDSHYRRAVTILDRWHKKLDETFGTSTEKATEALTHDDEIELEVYMKAAAIKMAENASAELEVDKNKVAEDLLRDPKIRRHLQSKYSIRAKGHLEGRDLEPPPPQVVKVPEAKSAGEPPGEA